MFTLTFRLRKKVVMAVLCGIVVVMAGMIAVASLGPETVSVFGRRGGGTSAATNDERVNFIAARGLEVEETPISQMEVTIPAEFDTIYVGYNQIQQSQGFNLEKYRGKEVTKYSYAVKAPEGQSSETVASLLVYKDKVIGADLCSRELGGILKALGEAEPAKK